MILQELQRQLNVEPNHEAQSALYRQNFIGAIMEEGLSEDQAGIISHKAWEDGHSSGYSDVVGCAMDLCYFVKKILDA